MFVDRQSQNRRKKERVRERKRKRKKKVRDRTVDIVRMHFEPWWNYMKENKTGNLLHVFTVVYCTLFWTTTQRLQQMKLHDRQRFKSIVVILRKA